MGALLIKTSQKTEILHEKMSKKVPKRPPSPAKTEVLHEKKCLFLLKNTTQPLKKLKFCIKNDKKLTKKLTQKKKNHPQKPEVLHEKLKTVLPIGILKKKKSRSPISPNFKTHKKIFLHFFNYIATLVKIPSITYKSFIKIEDPKFAHSLTSLTHLLL